MWILIWWICSMGCGMGQGTMANKETCQTAAAELERSTALQAHCVYAGDPR